MLDSDLLLASGRHSRALLDRREELFHAPSGDLSRACRNELLLLGLGLGLVVGDLGLSIREIGLVDAEGCLASVDCCHASCGHLWGCSACGNVLFLSLLLCHVRVRNAGSRCRIAVDVLGTRGDFDSTRRPSNALFVRYCAPESNHDGQSSVSQRQLWCVRNRA